MASTTFIDYSEPVVSAAWLNEINDRNYEVANVKSDAYGAVGDGVTDDTAAFVLAAASGNTIYVPSGTYLLDGFNAGAFGVKLAGTGTIKTASGALIQLSSVNLEPHVGPQRYMFVEGNKPSVEELLHIKSLGYTCVMAYLWYISIDTLVKNAEAVGLNVLQHYPFANIPVTVTPDVTYDSRPSVIGYYLCDEPVINGESVADQDRVIDAYRLVTSKPLYTAEQSVVFDIPNYLSSKWDVIFSDSYYADSYSAGIEPITVSLRNFAEYSSQCPRSLIVPLVGLFNDDSFTKSKTVTAQLAETLVKFSSDGSFGVFVWDAGIVADTYEGVRNTPEYLESAASLVSIMTGYKPWQWEIIHFNANYSNSKIHAIAKPFVDGAAPGLLGTPTLLPWEVKNAGSIIDFREQNFAASGLMASATGGSIGFPGMPCGLCAAYYDYSNLENAATATISIGYSTNGGFEFTSVASTAALANEAQTFHSAVLSTMNSYMPAIKVLLSATCAQPYTFVTGYAIFSNIPAVTF